jgi:hypothetical protein
LQRGDVVKVSLRLKFAHDSDSFGNAIPAQDVFFHVEPIDFYSAQIPDRALIVQLNLQNTCDEIAINY